MDGVYINGQWRTGAGAHFQNHCPATGGVVWEGRGANEAEVNEAVASARQAFHDWANRPRATGQQFWSGMRTKSKSILTRLQKPSAATWAKCFGSPDLKPRP